MIPYRHEWSFNDCLQTFFFFLWNPKMATNAGQRIYFSQNLPIWRRKMYRRNIWISPALAMIHDFLFLSTKKVPNNKKKDNRCDMALFDWYLKMAATTVHISFLSYGYLSFRLILFHFHCTYEPFLVNKLT